MSSSMDYWSRWSQPEVTSQGGQGLVYPGPRLSRGPGLGRKPDHHHPDPDRHFTSVDKLTSVLSRLLHAWSELERPCIAICTATTAIAARVQSQPAVTMMIRCRLSLPALVLALASVAYSINEEDKSIDQIIMEAASNVEMFDMLHLSPEGDLMVMVELDILMSLKQYMELKEDPEVTRSKRKAMRSADLKWRDRTVYYELSGDLSEYSLSQGQTIKDLIQ
ncbi:uncharacterized protein LOC112561899 isoform X1 [Pomacea canaliculata]|uniref:uncharacterized protein LOC112561899 isoform X1 n=2 Tax=Pomacea canaliculata TaxID=400727 RepID=UPI000D73A0F9|nr:uncharacterized protein LOC112561899 isoform X1 [Pomacea canaliculata]